MTTVIKQSDFIKRQHKVTTELREQLASHLWQKEEHQKKFLESIVYAAFGFRALRDTLPDLSISLKTYLSTDPWKYAFQEDLPRLDAYLAVADSFDYDPYYLGILKKCGCFALLPSAGKECQQSVRDQLEERIQRGGLKFKTPDDFFGMARRGLLEIKNPIVDETPNDSDVRSEASAEQKEQKDTAPSHPFEDNLQPEPEPRPSTATRNGHSAETQREAPAVNPEEVIFQERMKELQRMLKNLSTARALFTDTEQRFKPLPEWGDAIVVLKAQLLPWSDVIHQLSEL